MIKDIKGKAKFMAVDMLDIMKKNMRPFRELMTSYNCAMMEIETKLRVLNEEYSLDYDRNPIESIKTRLKTPDGIAKKVARKNVALEIEEIEKNIHDIAGVRVVCAFLDDIYEVSQWLVNQDDIKLISTKDYIKNPKANGYRSLHIIVEVPVFLHKQKKDVKVEVQFRTIAMDFWASLEHKVHYKKNVPVHLEDEITTKLYECAEASAELDLKMQNIKKQVF